MYPIMWIQNIIMTFLTNYKPINFYYHENQKFNFKHVLTADNIHIFDAVKCSERTKKADYKR